MDTELTGHEQFVLATKTRGDIRTVLSMSKKGFVNAHTIDFTKSTASFWLTAKGKTFIAMQKN